MAEESRVHIEIVNRNSPLISAVRLESVFPREIRQKIAIASLFILIVAGVLFLVFSGVAGISGGAASSGLRGLLGGLFLIFFGPFWFFAVAEFYFLSTSRSQPFFRVSLQEGERIFFLNYGGARRLWFLDAFRKEEIDAAKLYEMFPKSQFMRELFLRLGISRDDLALFLKTRTAPLPLSRDTLFQTLIYEAVEANSDTVTAREFLLLLFDADKDFEKFLFEREIRKQELLGAAMWVTALLDMKRSRMRWWERAVLGRLPSFGVSLMFGYTFTLDKFARDVSVGSQGAIIPQGFVHKKEIEMVSEILARSSQTNVLLVGDPGSGKMSILQEIVRTINEGSASPDLWQKRLIAVDAGALTATMKQKGDLEELIIRVMNEASTAGNVVLVMERFPEFIQSASFLGVNVVTLLEPYLEGSSIQVVALSDKEQFHQLLEPNGTVMKLFEKVEVVEPATSSTVFVLEEIAYDLEKRFPVRVTYQSLLAASELADRYIAEGAMPEKAIDLLERALAVAEGKGEYLVTKEHIERAVEERTHIPVGKAGGQEAKRLLNLEELLHKRIIGQDTAVSAVANALRRARSGLHAGKRPVGSFLFLGPTGVGKTETAKVLADVYFGSEKTMIRFDMSEFHGPEGLNKLIGSFDTKEPGALANSLRTQPFSLLLFDEFEKASRDVINLFLQILEEGFFTDAFGKRVSARDAIIIATSNAGSNLIWELVRQGKDPAQAQKEVVDAIRQQGVFTPEILNRFDGIVVFEPLSKEKLLDVARILLGELASRLKEQDIGLVITEELIAKVVEIGYDPTMGARPMRRAITDRIEQVIARKLLDGTLQRGGTIQFTPEEIAQL